MNDFANASEICVESDFITTKDGIKLFVISVKPKRTGRFPIVFMSSPYNVPCDTSLTSENYLNYNPLLYNTPPLVCAGYCVVYMHARGSGNSTGTFQYALHDCSDICETLNWVRTQEFYNEEIYRFGVSYMGMTSLIDARMHHQDVKGIVACVPAPRHPVFANRNGFFKTGLLGWWYTTQLNAYFIQKKMNFTPDIWRSFPQKDWGNLIYDEPQPTFDSSLNHPDENDRYWCSDEAPGHDYYCSLEQLDVPTLFVSGWFDLFIDEAIHVWNQVIPEDTRKKSAFIITPYNHGYEGVKQRWPFKMEGSFGVDAFPNYVVNWFNHIRSGEPLEHVKLNEITFFPEAGQKKWYYEKESFTDGEGLKILYLNEDRKMDTAQGNISETTYLYNPYNPAIFYGGGDRNYGYALPGHEPEMFEAYNMVPQDPPNSRYDIISFEAEPFEEEMFIKGGMSADLYVKSDCEDTCFYVRVNLVKNGVTYGIRDDITSLCYQHGDYTPGEEVKLHFEFSPIVWAIQPGDQLRIDVTSSCFPLYSLHTNIKGLQCNIEKPGYAHNTVVFGKSSFTYHMSALSADEYGMVVVEDRVE